MIVRTAANRQATPLKTSRRLAAAVRIILQRVRNIDCAFPEHHLRRPEDQVCVPGQSGVSRGRIVCARAEDRV